MRCFASRGFRGTTTRDVAGEVGISEAALYRYFESKEALYAAIVDEKIRADEWVAPLEAAAARGDDRAVFGGLARHLLENTEADPSFLRILLYTALEGHALAEPFVANRVVRLREFLADYIAERIAQGVFRKVSPRLAARAFLGMAVDYLIVREVYEQREDYPEPASEVVDTFLEIFLNGVRQSPERGHER